jgi:hypothetical protein
MSLARRGWTVLAFVLVLVAALGRAVVEDIEKCGVGYDRLELAPHSVETLRGDFNQAADTVRVIVLLSPT